MLPSGPIWDYWKNAAISYFERNDDPAQCPLLTDPRCPSLVLHSIYTVLKLRNVVHGALWPALRESSPYTAITTIDNHLARLQWEDCYAQHCRSVLLGEMTPLEVWTSCGPMFCPPDYPPELENAIKRGVATALTRANMGVIKNICGLNWIIAPLGAEIKPVYYVPPEECVDPPDEYPIFPEQPVPCIEVPPDQCIDQDTLCDPSPCANVAFEICNVGDYLPGIGSGDVCETLVPVPPVLAYWDRGCDRPAGLPDRVWPGVLAAECIVRSMLPPQCPSNITRCC
jgi:hypothetical protein